MAGIANASLITSVVGGGVGGDDLACFHVAGMQDLPGERAAHVYWIHETSLVPGDHLRYTFLESDGPTPPIEVKATDSPKYLQEQREFEEVERNYGGRAEPAPRRWPALEFGLKLRNESTLRARMPLDQEFIMCSVQWDKWRPERCTIYVRSFARSAQRTDKRTTEWLRGFLQLGESFELAVHA